MENGIIGNLLRIKNEIPPDVSIVAVSKTKSPEMILELLNAGHLDFGENKVQELLDKYDKLPKEIRWHMIGHLQTNKVKYIAPFVYLIHGVDSLKLYNVIEKEGRKNNRIIDILFQVYIAMEETKYGLTEDELVEILHSSEIKESEFVRVRGLMGMATFINDSDVVRAEFKNLKRIFERINKEFFAETDSFNVLSMGMSADYNLAILEGSNMIRVGSSIFGPRYYL